MRSLLRAAGATALLLALAAPAPPPAAAAENGVIAFSATRAGSRVLYTKAPDGTQTKLLRTGGWTDQPVASPGGRRLAFTRFGPGGTQQVWSQYLDGKVLRQVTSGPADSLPAWSPNGAQVAFARGVAGARDIYRQLADGNGLVRLTFSARNDDAPDWSVRNEIAFVRRNTKSNDLYAMSANGGATRRLTRSPLDDRDPDWSPTGNTLVYSKGRAGKRDLYVLSSDGRRVRRLTAVPGDETQPEFSPDGTRVVFVHTRRGQRRLYLIKVAGKAVTKLPASRGLRARRLTSASSAAGAPAWQPAGLDPVIAAAGDIACNPQNSAFNGGLGTPGACRQRATSDLLLRSDLAEVLVPGDLQYERGELGNFMQSFDPSWGRVKELLRPVPGNHEYDTANAAGYYDYFNGVGRQTGQAGDRSAGYYSFDIDNWHIVALNSECETIAGGCGTDSTQLRWLRADLAAHPSTCTLAYFHKPLFTSGRYGNQSPDLRAFWDALYAANAELILVGHEHFYERFAPQNPDGVADPARGIRQLTVGMGGRGRHDFITTAANSEFRTNNVLGVAELGLGDAGYSWRLVNAATGGTADSGSGACH
jgi:hypothetical protein